MDTCKNCEITFLELVAKECGVENAIECDSDELEKKMCLKCITRIMNRYI